MTELNEKSIFKCEYCNSILSSHSNLNTHKKTNKKCLSLRVDTIKKEFICSECGFITNFKHHISNHKCRQEYISIYKKYLHAEKENKIYLEKIHTIEKENKIYLEKIQKLKNKNKLLKTELTQKIEKQVEKHEKQLFSLASKPTSIKIQNLNNILGNLDFKENTIKEKVDNKFTLEYLSEGIKGLAKFTKEHIINPSEDGKQKYICSDPSRAMFK
jgi:hypothetical protein